MSRARTRGLNLRAHALQMKSTSYLRKMKAFRLSFRNFASTNETRCLWINDVTKGTSLNVYFGRALPTSLSTAVGSLSLIYVPKRFAEERVLTPSPANWKQLIVNPSTQAYCNLRFVVSGISEFTTYSNVRIGIL